MSLTFALTSYVYDHEKAVKTVADLRRNYPRAEIVHLNDDPPNRLKLPQFAGRWTERWMEAALATSADIIIKVDPDTLVIRPLADFPEADMFGVASKRRLCKGVILGGAYGFRRSAVEKIVGSRLLLDGKYTSTASMDYIFCEYRPGRKLEILSLQDPIVFDVVTLLGLTTAPWADVYMYNEDYVMPKVDHSKYGFVHE
jgi:hypothetical protein